MNGIDLKYGLTTPDEQEAIIKHHAMQLGTQVYVLIDHDKYEKVYFAHVPLEEGVSIITSKKAQSLKQFHLFAGQYNFIGGTL